MWKNNYSIVSITTIKSKLNDALLAKSLACSLTVFAHFSSLIFLQYIRVTTIFCKSHDNNSRKKKGWIVSLVLKKKLQLSFFSCE